MANKRIASTLTLLSLIGSFLIIILQGDDATVDPVVLSTLPPSLQLEVMLKMRERQMAANRGGFEERTGKPEAFSEFQINQYLKASKLRHQLDIIRGSGAGQSGTARPVAAEESREYVLERDEPEAQHAQQAPVVNGSQPENGNNISGSQGQEPNSSGVVVGAGRATPGLVRDGTGGDGSASGGGLKISFEVEMDEILSDNSLEWEDIDDDDIGTATGDGGGGDGDGDGGDEHWRERAARRQKYWSLSHGFQMGRKLAQWGENDNDDDTVVQMQGDPDLNVPRGGKGSTGIGIAGNRGSPVRGTAPGGAFVNEDEDAQLQEAIRRSLDPNAKGAVTNDTGAGDDGAGPSTSSDRLINKGSINASIKEKKRTVLNGSGAQPLKGVIRDEQQQQAYQQPTKVAPAAPELTKLSPKQVNPLEIEVAVLESRKPDQLIAPSSSQQEKKALLHENGVGKVITAGIVSQQILAKQPLSASPVPQPHPKTVRFTLPEKEPEKEQEEQIKLDEDEGEEPFWEDEDEDEHEEQEIEEVERIQNPTSSVGQPAEATLLSQENFIEMLEDDDEILEESSQEIRTASIPQQDEEAQEVEKEPGEPSPSQKRPEATIVPPLDPSVPAPLSSSQQDAAREQYEDFLASAWTQPTNKTTTAAAINPSEPPAPAVPAVRLDPEALQREEASLRAEHRAAAGQSDTPTDAMYRECQELLQLFGLPYLIAPAEAEAQAAWLDSIGLVDAVVTDDNDAFLFGAQMLYRNIFEGSKYVEEYRSSELESELGLDRERLVALALLLGSDYTAGVAGIGVVNAVEIVHAFSGAEGLKRFATWVGELDEQIVALAKKAAKQGKKTKRGKKGEDTASDEEDEERGSGNNNDDNSSTTITVAEREYKRKHRNLRKSWNLPKGFPSLEVMDAYLDPKVDDAKDKFTFARPDLDLLRRFCSDRFGWEQSRTDELLLPVLKAYDERQTQQTLDNFVAYRQRFAKIRSKRLRQAVAGITGADNEELALQDDEEGGEPSRPAKKKATAPRKKKAKKTTAAGDGDGDGDGGGDIDDDDDDIEIVEEVPPPPGNRGNRGGRGRGRGRGRAGGRGTRRSKKGQQEQAALAAAADYANNDEESN